MKKFISLLLCTSIVLNLTGCDSESQNQNDENTEKESQKYTEIVCQLETDASDFYPYHFTYTKETTTIEYDEDKKEVVGRHYSIELGLKESLSQDEIDESVEEINELCGEEDADDYSHCKVEKDSNTIIGKKIYADKIISRLNETFEGKTVEEIKTELLEDASADVTCKINRP